MATLSIWKFTSPDGAEQALRTLARLFLLPVVGMAIGVAVGLAAGALSRVGLSDEFLQRIRDRITPGSSALFLLTSDEVVDRVRGAFAGTHAELLVTNLSKEQEAALRTAFDDGEEPEIRPEPAAVTH